jgi:5-methylcytosine-specific restriction endonuclease McrA
MRRRKTVIKLYERDGGWCRLCGLAVERTGSDATQRATIDHILPKSKGGKDNLENLQLAHAGCNFSKGNNVEGNK